MMSYVLPGWVKWAALAVLALALYAFGRVDGYAIAAKELADYKVQLADAVIRLQTAQAQVVTETQTVVQEKIRIVKEKGDVVIREVPIYISVETDRQFPLSNGFVRVHDAAASGEAAGSAAGTDGQAATVTASFAAETIASNYTECRKLAEQVIGWQAFYQKLQNTANIP
jgi:hypothetical protein